MFLPHKVSAQQLQMEIIQVRVRKPKPTPYSDIAICNVHCSNDPLIQRSTGTVGTGEIISLLASLI